MTINKQKSAIKVAGALGCSEDADGWPLPYEFLSQELSPKYYVVRPLLPFPSSLLPALPNATSPADKADTCPLLGEPGQASGSLRGANSEKISWTWSQLPLARRGGTFPNLIIWRNIINAFLWPSFRKVRVESIYFAYLYLLQPKEQKDR